MFQKAVVYAKDVGNLVEYVQNKRGMKPEDTLVKIGTVLGVILSRLLSM